MTTGEFIIVQYTASYVLFFAVLIFSSLYHANRFVCKNGIAERLSLVFITHWVGIFLFGVLPFLLLNSTPIFYEQHLEIPWPAITSISVFFFVLVMAPLLANREFNPIRNSIPTAQYPGKQTIIFYFITRTVFIIAYETWFRGFLLKDSIKAFGELNAVLLNVLLYAILHIVNGRKEFLSCIPFGILLCSLCIWQSAVWPAILIHLALTISYEATMIIKINSKPINHESFYHGSIRIHR